MIPPFASFAIPSTSPSTDAEEEKGEEKDDPDNMEDRGIAFFGYPPLSPLSFLSPFSSFFSLSSSRRRPMFTFKDLYTVFSKCLCDDRVEGRSICRVK